MLFLMNSYQNYKVRFYDYELFDVKHEKIIILKITLENERNSFALLDVLDSGGASLQPEGFKRH